MSELDDAIREHLELKRRHGARDAELKELEDEAFGTGERPLDPFKAGAEAVLKDGEEGDKPEEGEKPADKPVDLDLDLGSEAPPAQPDAPAEPPPAVPEDAELADAPPSAAAEAPAGPPPPAPDTPIPPPPPTPDRAGEVAQQPTEEHPPPEPPSDEIPEAEIPAEEPGFDEEPALEEEGGDSPLLYDFESDSVASSGDDVLIEPEPGEQPPLEPPTPEPEPEDSFEERAPLPDPDDAFADLGPAEPGGGGGELPLEDEDLPQEEALSHDADVEGEEGPGAVTADTSEREALGLEPTEQYSLPAEDEPAPQFEESEPGPAPASDQPEGEDILEETPDFLEEKPEGEDEDLWFEKKPPKDFDFEDE